MEHAFFPFGRKINEFLDYIFQILSICVINYEKEEISQQGYNEIQKVLEPLYSLYRNDHNYKDRHIFKCDVDISISTDPQKWRIVKIIVGEFIEAKKMELSYNLKGDLLPSPLRLFCLILTLPDQTQTWAYPFATSRAYLHNKIKVCFSKNVIHEGFTNIAENDLFNEYATIKKYIAKSDNLPVNRIKIKLFLYHFLALKGFFYLRFDKKVDLNGESNLKKYLANSELIYQSQFENNELEFFFNRKYKNLPDFAGVINDIRSVPLPISGADTIFFNGFKKTSNFSLVISLSGTPGVGKTSVALSLAVLLHPMNSVCCYLSFEEAEDDLRNRLETVTPSFLPSLSIYNPKKEDWFIPKKISLDDDSNLESIESFLDELNLKFEEKKNDVSYKNSDSWVACPFIIILDSINGIINDKKDANYSYNKLEKFIEKCRTINGLVILLSGSNLPIQSRLDYLVDVVIDLKHEGTDSIEQKAFRVFHLIKTRHQISRPGSHIFHISGESGFRLSPQVPSQIDRLGEEKLYTPNYKEIMHTFNLIYKNGFYRYQRFLDLHPNSKILIHGFGSSGKAGLGLRILLTPPIPANIVNQSEPFEFKCSQNKYKRKVLILSFLYDEDYYSNLLKNIQPDISNCYTKIQEPELGFIEFYPGFVTPEDFIQKIVKKLDKAYFEGDPYNGILLDGLHNVFLQFKNLQDRPMVWPMLYSLLSKYPLTVVTTFTNFEINRIKSNDNTLNNPMNYQDLDLIQKGQTPFLHSIVQASDFYLSIEHIEQRKVSERKQHREYQIYVKSAINQKIITNPIGWNREKSCIEIDMQGELDFKKEKETE